MARFIQAGTSRSALQHNFQLVKELVGDAQMAAIVKVNGYGHGAVEVARSLPDADIFGVASIKEALELVESGIRQPVLLLEGFSKPVSWVISPTLVLKLLYTARINWTNCSTSNWNGQSRSGLNTTAASTGTPILVNGQRTQLLGRVSMDMISVELTDLPDAQVGDSVVLWGEGPDGKRLCASEVARHADTIPWVLLTGIASRVPLVYGD